MMTLSGVLIVEQAFLIALADGAFALQGHSK
jgi:hypothetical protein